MAGGGKVFISNKNGILFFCNLEFFKRADLTILKSKSLAEEELGTEARIHCLLHHLSKLQFYKDINGHIISV